MNIWTYKFIDEDTLSDEEKKQVALESLIDYLEANDLITIKGNEVTIDIQFNH